MDRTLWAALVLYAAAGVFAMQYYTFAADEYVYMNLASEINDGTYATSPDVGRPPLLPYLNSIVYRVTGPSELATKALNLMLGAGLVLLTYFVTREHFGKQAGGWASLAVATNPFVLFFAGRALSEILFMLLAVGCTYALLKTREDFRWFVPLGALTTLLVLARYPGLLLLPGFMMVALYLHRQKLLTNGWMYAGVVAAAVFFAPYGIISAQITGNPLGLMMNFIGSAAQAPLSAFASGVPDRIPSYLLTAPLIFGAFLLPLVVGIILQPDWKKKVQKAILDERVVAFVLPALLLLVLIEFTVSLKELRYSSVLAPLVLIPACAAIGKRLEQKEVLRKLAFVCIGMNLLAGLAITYYFGAIYEKQVAHANVGKYLAQNCGGTVLSNAPHLVRHYTRQPEDSINPDCILYTDYEGQNPQVKAKLGHYQAAYASGKATVYVRQR